MNSLDSVLKLTSYYHNISSLNVISTLKPYVHLLSQHKEDNYFNIYFDGIYTMRNKILHKSLTAVEMLKQVSTKTILTCLALGTFLSFGYTAHADNNTNNPPPAPANFNQTSGAVDISTGTATVTFSVPAGGIECLTGPVTLQLEVDGDFNGNYTGAAGADPCSLGPGICPPSDEEIRITGTGITGTLGYNEDGNSSNGVFSVAAANVPTVATAFACQAVGNTFTYTFSVGTEVDLDAGTAVRVNLSFDYEH